MREWSNFDEFRQVSRARPLTQRKPNELMRQPLPQALLVHWNRPKCAALFRANAVELPNQYCGASVKHNDTQATEAIVRRQRVVIS